MRIFLIKLLGFLIGLFITLLIINYFDVKRKEIETFEVIPVVPSSNINKIVNDNAKNPYYTDKYMCINTYFDATKIDNIQKKWFECDLDKSKMNITSNEKHYFSYETSNITLKPNIINDNGEYGADINNIVLSGPKSFYFANNIETNELKEFSILMSIKINDITNSDNILFELTGNSQIINNKPTSSMINLNIKLNKNKLDFIITIGDKIYNVLSNIDKSSLIKNDLNEICFIYSYNNQFTLILNREIKTITIKADNNEKIKLGSMPILINKGKMNIHLYSFIYYKTSLETTVNELFHKHNYYYLSGLNKANLKAKEKEVVKPEPVNIQKELKDLHDNISKTIDDKIKSQVVVKSDIEYQKIQPLEIPSIKDSN